MLHEVDLEILKISNTFTQPTALARVAVDDNHGMH